MASSPTRPAAKSAPKTPAKLGPSWTYTPRPQKVSDGNVFSSTAKKPESSFTNKLKGTPIDSSKQVSTRVSPAKLNDIKPEAYGSNEAQQALEQANLGESYLTEIQKRVWDTIAEAPRVEQELQIFVTLLTFKRIIDEAELPSSLLRVLDQANDDPEDEDARTISEESTPSKIPAQSKKPSKSATKGQKSNKDKMQVDAKGPRLRKSARIKNKYNTTHPAPTNKKTKSILKSRVANVKLEPVRLSLSSRIGIEDTEHLRDRFIDILKKTKVQIKKNQNNVIVRLDDDSQKLIVNSFFTEFMSSKALTNVKAIINSSNKSVGEDQKAYHAIHARKAAKSLPPVLKKFANNLAASIELQTMSGAYKVFRQYQADYNMYDSYQQAVLALYNDSELRDFFESRDYKTSRGRDWRSVLKDYFCDHVYPTTSKNWDNVVHQTAPIWHLVRHFGHGILLLLREEHKTRFVNIGVGTINAIAPIIAAITPDFAWGVRILGETVYDALVQGEIEKLPQTPLVERGGSFLANIQGCFDPDHRVDRPAEVELEDEESSDDESESEEEEDAEQASDDSDESASASEMDTD